VTDELLSIDEALALVLGRAARLAGEEVAVSDADGRVLAAPALAAVDLPPFPSSAMDGFAVRAADTPGTLAVVGASAAGRPSGLTLSQDEAIAISTGAVVPEGADAVVPVEDVSADDATVAVPGVVSRSANVRARGSDLGAGATVIEAGVRLGPGRLGALAAAGLVFVRCARRPRVAVLVIGTELRDPGATLGPGEIYDSNGLVLEAQARSAGAEVVRLPRVEDDEGATRNAIARGLEANVLLTTGGVSVGEHDLVRAAEAALGVEEVFWRVAVRPGKPISFGVRGATLVFGLPGNPVSALVGFELFVRPALLALQGAADPGPAFLPGRLAAPVRANGARDSLPRARSRVEDGAVLLEALSGQESHMIARAAGADALVLVPRGEGELSAGSPVRYLAL
jgi:molybdopterin molybdotransferase